VAHTTQPAPRRHRLVARVLRHRFGNRRGQSLVEFALILPVFMLFFATTLDLGRLAAAQLSVANAAKEGAFQAAQTPTDFNASNPCPAAGDSNVILCRVQLELKNSGVAVNPADIAVNCSQSGCPKAMGSRVTVAVTGRFQLLTPVLAPFFGGTNIAFTRSATTQLEALPAPVTAGAITTTTSTSTSTSSTATSTTTTTTSTTTACLIPSAGFTSTISPSDRTAPVTLTVVDTTTSPSCAITSWFWQWGDGTTSLLQNPGAHLYLAKGTYKITLTVTNAAGTDTTGALNLVVK
jgi:Flp pilus assembly protein TadG